MFDQDDGTTMDYMKSFRSVALLEATSFLVLLALTAVKYGADSPMGVQILGPIHGALFVIYVALALMVRRSAGWGFWTTIAILFGAVLPFGGYAVDRWIERNASSGATTQR